MIYKVERYRFLSDIVESDKWRCLEALKSLDRIPSVAWVDVGPLDVLATVPDADPSFWTHGAVIAIKEADSILDYLDDPIHHEVVELILPFLERIEIVDMYGLPRDDSAIARQRAKLAPLMVERAKRLPASVLKETARLRAK
jgi:hypothetical protein